MLDRAMMSRRQRPGCCWHRSKESKPYPKGTLERDNESDMV